MMIPWRNCRHLILPFFLLKVVVHAPSADLLAVDVATVAVFVPSAFGSTEEIPRDRSRPADIEASPLSACVLLIKAVDVSSARH